MDADEIEWQTYWIGNTVLVGVAFLAPDGPVVVAEFESYSADNPGGWRAFYWENARDYRPRRRDNCTQRAVVPDEFWGVDRARPWALQWARSFTKTPEQIHAEKLARGKVGE